MCRARAWSLCAACVAGLTPLRACAHGTDTMAATIAASCIQGTLQVLRPGVPWAASPAAGIAIHRWPANQLALARFLQRRGTGSAGSGCSGDASAALALALFHAVEEGAPLRDIRNKSFPASWLNTELFGRVLAVAQQRSGQARETDCRPALQQLGIRSNHVDGEHSGVSLARFEHLLPLLTAEPAAVARCACLKAAAEGGGDAQQMRAALLRYMHGAALLSPQAKATLLVEGPERTAWLQSTPPRVCRADAQDAAGRLLSSGVSGVRTMEDVETVLIALVHADALPGPPLHSEAKRSRGEHQKPKGDCVEHALRSLVDLVVWDTVAQRWDPSRLPTTTMPAVRAFYLE
eukprot:COSAG02_NODE_1195_length_13940_cov_15.482407_4_plen_349_part_00